MGKEIVVLKDGVTRRVVVRHRKWIGKKVKDVTSVYRRALPVVPAQVQAAQLLPTVLAAVVAPVVVMVPAVVTALTDQTETVVPMDQMVPMVLTDQMETAVPIHHQIAVQIRRMTMMIVI